MKTQLQQLVQQEVQAIKELDEEVWKKKKEVIERFTKKRELLMQVCEHKDISVDTWYGDEYSFDGKHYTTWTEESRCSNCGKLMAVVEHEDYYDEDE